MCWVCVFNQLRICYSHQHRYFFNQASMRSREITTSRSICVSVFFFWRIITHKKQTNQTMVCSLWLNKWQRPTVDHRRLPQMFKYFYGNQPRIVCYCHRHCLLDATTWPVALACFHSRTSAHVYVCVCVFFCNHTRMGNCYRVAMCVDMCKGVWLYV